MHRVLSLCLICIGTTAAAQDEAELAQQLANPIAAIVSVPFQLNFDENIGPSDQGSRTTFNFQPVVPFALENGANVVTRTIVPYIWQDDIVPGTSQSGFGDILFSAWYSKTTAQNLTWGVGPVLRIPTGSDVSTETWAAGVTGIALKTEGPWTYGALANHIWDLESNPTTPTSSSFVQPFVAYSTATAWTFSVTSESTYDWISSEWSIPVNVNIAKLAPVADIPINWQLGVGYWASSPDNGPEGMRVRLQPQIVLPRG
ncbi:transporter [Ruegeria lacuscaerulensis]|uniref:transporter n=1 Tax=Ruegeria lacuscaerulensis TaxID=55218 RepID=UPI00147DEC60|nr:transporter [Ruegeria lacuscaerulensis]